jgi:hypothetical protein
LIINSKTAGRLGTRNNQTTHARVIVSGHDQVDVELPPSATSLSAELTGVSIIIITIIIIKCGNQR